jgi:hypothetical protein
MMCEICGSDECTCPPCSCIWCRHQRGETSVEERTAIYAQQRAFILAEERAAIRASAKRMKATIEVLKNKQEPLGEEFEKVLRANAWDLYVR